MSTVRETLTDTYGDNWAKSIDHVVTVADSGYPEYRDVIVIAHTKSNDVFGYDDAVEVANYRVLSEQWADYDGLSDGPYSNCRVIALDLDSEAPEDLCEVIDHLADYPVLSEDEWSSVEQEFIREHWDSYGRSDVIRAVEQAIDADSLTDAGEAIVEQLVWSGRIQLGNGSEYPSMIDSSACEFGEEVVAEFIRMHLGDLVEIPVRWEGDSPLVVDLTNIVL